MHYYFIKVMNIDKSNIMRYYTNMSYTVSITSQGQISIPSKIRQELGLSKRKKALVSIENGKMVVEPVRDFLELAGSLKTDKKPLSNQELDDFVGTAIAQEYAEKQKIAK